MLFGKKKIGGKTAEEWFKLGYEEGNLEKAVEYYTKALEIDSKYADAWMRKGLALDNLKRYEEAIKCYDKVLEIDPEDGDAWRQKGIALYMSGKYDEAIRSLDNALERYPKSVDAWTIKAKALHDLGRYAEATGCYDKALEIDPSLEIAKENKKIAEEKLREKKLEEIKTNVKELVEEEKYETLIELYERDNKVLKELTQLVNDNNWLVRSNITSALGEIGEKHPESIKEAIPILMRLLDDEDRRVRSGAALNIGEIGEYYPEKIQEAIPKLISMLEDEDTVIYALEYISSGHPPENIKLAIPPLVKLLDVKNASDCAHTALTIGYIGLKYPESVKEAVPKLVKLLGDDREFVRHDSAKALGYIGLRLPESVEDAIPKLLELLGDRDHLMRRDAAFALGLIGRMPENAKDVINKLIKILKTEVDLNKLEDEQVYEEAIIALGRIGNEYPESVKEAIPELMRLLDNSEARLREYATYAIGLIGEKYPEGVIEANSKLIKLLDDEKSTVCGAAIEALGRIRAEEALNHLEKKSNNSAIYETWSSQECEWVGKTIQEVANWAIQRIEGEGGYAKAKGQIKLAKDSVESLRDLDKFISTSDVENLIGEAENAFNIKNYSNAVKLAKRVKVETLKIKEDHKRCKETSDFIASIEPEIIDIKGSGVKTPKSDEFIEQAKSELNKTNFERAKDLASEARRTALERKESYEKALKSISSVDVIISDSKGYGIVVSNAEVILKNARNSLEEGEYEEAYNSSKEAERIAKETDTKYREVKDCIESSEATIEKVKEFCAVSEATNLLDKANSTFAGGSYDDALKYAKQAGEAAKRRREESKPEIKVELPEKTFKPNYWKSLDLIIGNKGNAHAKDMNIKFSEEVKIRGLEIIERLDAGEKISLEVSFKPVDVGERVPLEIITIFEDFDGKRYEETETVHINVGEIKREIPIEKEIEIKRGYEILQNNDLRFGIHVINNTGYAIMDAETILDYPRTLFSLKDTVVQTLANIHPNGERTAKYTLTPLGCIHNEKIGATVIYKDHTGEKQAVQMRAKEVHCVCPFLKEKAMREGEFAELANACEHIQEGLSFSGIGVKEITAFIKEACAHRLYVICEHEIDTAKIVYFAGESIGEKAYYLLTAVIQPYKNLTQVALRAYSDKPYGLHGFLTEIGSSIQHLVGSVQSAKEIGIIENKQVINIIDSVVQRTSIGGVGEGTGATSVNIEGSVVQRSEIGSVRSCSNCGKEVQGDEKFCTACGARLE